MYVKRSGISTLAVKDANIRTVLNSLKRHHSASVQELSADTGLSVVTVKGIIDALIEQERAAPGEQAPSTGGRPSRRYLFNETHRLGLLMFAREISGKDAVCLRVIDLYGTVIDADDVVSPNITPNTLETLAADKIREFDRIQALGIGLPGVEYQGRIVSLDYEALVGTSLVQDLQSRFSIPVLMENDVNAAVLGRTGNSPPEPCMVYIYFPRKYPPGAGILVHGNLVKGGRHFAGEIGQLPLGIEWGEKTADSFETCCSAAAQVIITLAAVLDPDSAAVFGEHITGRHMERITELCRSQLPDHILPELIHSQDFSADFQQGLKYLTLNLLEEEQHIW